MAANDEHDQHDEGGATGASAVKAVAEMDLPEPDRDGKVVVEAATAETLGDAGEWLLAASEQEQVTVNRLVLDVGAPDQPIKIPWTIRSLDGPTIRRIRGNAADQLARGSRRRNGGAVDEAETAFRANLAIVVAGTYTPDLRELALAKQVADPAILVEQAFSNKQGIIDQVAGEILSLSGYDDEAVQDASEVSAAGNSLA